MRLSEAVGLLKENIILDDSIPHVIIQSHPWRSLKTKGSARVVPLVGVALLASKRLLGGDSSYAFPSYCGHAGCKANSASGALNKWLKPRVRSGGVVHSFRHSIRDRLRAVECPSDVIDQIGGWSSGKAGEAYVAGHNSDALLRYVIQIDG